MKAKFVFENIKFERGRDPKTAIGIGGIHLFKDLMLNRSDILKKDPEKWIEWMDVKNKILDELPDDFTNELSTDEQALEKIYIERPDIAKELTSNLNRFLTSNESVNFERGRDPKRTLGIGVIAKIEQIVNDAELLNDLFVEIDQQIISAMELYLPQEEKKEFARMWLSNLYDSLPHYEFKVLYREDGDEEDASGPKVDYEVKELEEQGWKVFWEEDNFGQVETILYKEIKDN